MNRELVFEAITLPFLWLIAYLFTTAIGYACVPFKRHSGVLSDNIFTWFWYGIGVVVVVLQIWNIFLPVSIYTWICLLPVAFFGAFKLVKDQKRLININPGFASLAMIGIIAIFLIVSTLDNSYSYDSLTYHFNTIKWLNNYPTILGMGNIFFCLGYNHSYFLYASFLNSLWGNYRGACATGGLLAMVICAEIVLSSARYVLKKEKLAFSAIFQILFLPLCINVGVQNLSSPTPDIYISLLTFKIFLDTIRCLESKIITFQDIFLLLCYSVLGVVMKLSFAGVGLGIFVVIIQLLSQKKLWRADLIIKGSFLLVLLLFPWIIRGIITSGYIGFPSTVLGLPVDWKIPADFVKQTTKYTVGISRTFAKGPAAMEAARHYNIWIPIWLSIIYTKAGFTIPLLLFIGTTLLFKWKRMSISMLNYLFAPLLIAILFWFLTAPQLRFAAFTFWTLGLAPLAYLIFQFRDKLKNIFVGLLYFCSVLIIVKNWNTDPEPFGDLPKQSTTVFVTKSGLKIYAIKNVPNNDVYLLSNCPIPCTYILNPNISLRGKSMKEGFKVVP